MSKSLQQKIKDIRKDQDDDQSDIDPEEYENLILDEIKIERLSEEDGKYLATFDVLESLSMNQTHLQSLEHLPKIKNLKRLELAENKLGGDDLKELAKFADSLEVLKLANNKITKLADLEHLSGLKCLKVLDFEGNEVCKADGYKDKVWAMFEKLEVLDHADKEGKEAFSDDDVDYDDEDGQDADGKGIFIDDMYGDEGFEGGEDDMDDFEGEEDELSEEPAPAKRQKH